MFAAIFVISRKSGRNKFHGKLSRHSTRDETKFFHREILGVGSGPRELVPKNLQVVAACVAAEGQRFLFGGCASKVGDPSRQERRHQGPFHSNSEQVASLTRF